MQNQPLNIDNFFENTKEDLENKIEKMIPDKKVISILKSGKRLRPLLAHLSFKACTRGEETDQEYQRALEGAVGIELAHTASLVHDDIIDEDKKRRGKPALHVKKGIPNALLTGHKMLAYGFNIALSHGKHIAKLYVDSWHEVVNGELEEVDFNKKGIRKSKDDFTKSKILDAYKKIINLKTASLFSSACKAGAVEANMTGTILKVFADYGREIGLAYQLADDLVDLINGEMIESVILPILNRLEHRTIIKAFKLRFLKKKILTQNSSEIERIYIDEIKKHIKNAEKLGKLEIIPDSPYKNLLMDAPTYIINKMLKEVKVII